MHRDAIAIAFLLGSILLAGCTDAGPAEDRDPGTVADGTDGGAAAVPTTWVPARFDDGLAERTLWLNGSIPQGEASGCNVRINAQEVCVGEEDRLDLAPHVAHGFAYAFNATLEHSPPDNVGATNIAFQESEPWGEAEWDRSDGREAVTGTFVRLTDEPLFLAVYHLLPAEHDITYSLRVDLELLQAPLAASVPIALDLDAAVTEIAVPLGDEGAARVWDGADAYLGRFVGNGSITGPGGTAVTVARINVSAVDRSAPLVLQVVGAPAGAAAVLVQAPEGMTVPPLRFLPAQATFVPHAAMTGPVEAAWTFTPDVVPLRVGAYMGAPDGMEPWSADGVHMVLAGPGGEALAETSSGCTFCGGGTVAAWSSWSDERVQDGAFAVTVDAADPYPQAVGAGGEVGHVVVAYVR